MPDGVYVNGKELASNVIVEIDSVCKLDRTETWIYRGRLKFNGRLTPFSVDTHELDSQPAQCIKRMLRSNNVVESPLVKGAWARFLLPVSTKLHVPKTLLIQATRYKNKGWLIPSDMFKEYLEQKEGLDDGNQ